MGRVTTVMTSSGENGQYTISVTREDAGGRVVTRDSISQGGGDALIVSRLRPDGITDYHPHPESVIIDRGNRLLNAPALRNQSMNAPQWDKAIASVDSGPPLTNKVQLASSQTMGEAPDAIRGGNLGPTLAV